MASASAAGTVSPGDRPGRGGGPGPFPVVVVRPATVVLPDYLRRDRPRQLAANQLAALVTEHSRLAGRHWPVLDRAVEVDLDRPGDGLQQLFGGVDELDDLVEQARALAWAPPPGAVRIGRNRRGCAVVAVLHGPWWSLVLRPALPDPVGWTFLGAYQGYSVRFRGVGAVAVGWQEMTREVYAALTGETG